ncbi:unnamed protein product [Ambrosiozyma monospora]|uniref:Unnamed protein product n=1 Tax=Ambrosiozyma monospora TaxID=43982 RepID=A0ACB5STR1_AMBMO|nr:unnamed protein product [Ambrosiozyma monospora]
MGHLQVAAPSVKLLCLNCTEYGKSCFDFLNQANTFIKKHKNLTIQFDICFFDFPIRTRWRLDSKTQFFLPLNTAYPTNTKEVDKIEQWCSVFGITSIIARASSTPFFTNTETVPFTRAVSSTVSTLTLDDFSTDYEIVLNGFTSLKKLTILYSTLKKFPVLPAFLKELTILFVNVLSISDIDSGIILPTQLCSLTWNGNICCFSLPKILNINKLLDLKSVSVRINPFAFSDSCDKELYSMRDFVTNDFLRIANTCTIDQLQRFFSQLPSGLKILKINIDGHIGSNSDNYSACSPNELSFNHFTDLKYLELKCLNNENSLNVTVFPCVEQLKFTSPPVLGGYFSQGIRSLDVNLQTYRESLSHFLSHFIPQLTSLVFLSICIDLKTSADLRNAAIPSQLCSFIIKFDSMIDPVPIDASFGCIILDTLPIQLNYFYLVFSGNVYDIIVDDCKGETISSMSKKISVSNGTANWIQYSHFDSDEESFGIESLYDAASHMRC